jgi:hypothetical protein
MQLNACEDRFGVYRKCMSTDNSKTEGRLAVMKVTRNGSDRSTTYETEGVQ